MAEELSKPIDKKYLENQFMNYTAELKGGLPTLEDLSKLVPKTRTIAGINLEDNVTIDELVTAIALSLANSSAFTTVYSKIADTGYKIEMGVDPETYIITTFLKNKSGLVLSKDSVDLPLESVVVDIDYNKEVGTIQLVLENGKKTPPIYVSDITNGLVTITIFNQTISDLEEKIDSIDVPTITFETENIDFSGYFS